MKINFNIELWINIVKKIIIFIIIIKFYWIWLWMKGFSLFIFFILSFKILRKMNKTNFSKLFHSTHHLQRKARTFRESVSPMNCTLSGSAWILPQLFFSNTLLLAEMQRSLGKIRKTSCQTNAASRCQCLRAVHVSG